MDLENFVKARENFAKYVEEQVEIMNMQVTLLKIQAAKPGCSRTEIRLKADELSKRAEIIKKSLTVI